MTLTWTWAQLGMALYWLLMLGLSIMAVFQLVGMRLMLAYFPEGRRWWQAPAQLASLAVFAAVIHFNPF